MNDMENGEDGDAMGAGREDGGIPSTLAIMPIRNIVLYPSMIAPVVIGDDPSKQLVEEALVGNRFVGMFTAAPARQEVDEYGESAPQLPDFEMKTIDVRSPDDDGAATIYRVGAAASIMKMLKIPDGSIRMLVHGVKRIRLEEIEQTTPYPKGRVTICEEKRVMDQETQAMIKNAQSMLQKLVEISTLPEDVLVAAVNLSEPGKVADMLASNMTLDVRERQGILELLNTKERLHHILKILNREVETQQIGKRIQSQVQTSFEKTQREHYLREQMKMIQRELGEGEGEGVELQELRERIAKAKLPEKPKQVAERELDRLEKMHPASAEYTVSITYLDWILSLPWKKSTKDNYDLKKAHKILEEDHYGLEKIKERIIEYLAVIKLKQKIKGPILCFVGPPGVGKTSLGRSIARALGRKFYRFSVGGMRDEAEIRGHRRTYIGALPGRIIKALRDCEANNPVIMLDEIDKIGADYRGDPSSALLETLDPEQNNTFTDNYLDMPFDLSKVMFITTANILDTVPAPLQDRMETLRLAGYTPHEKLMIAKQYLVKRQLEATGLTKRNVDFEDEGIRTIIESYTREAGVRNLEREIGNLCRKVARRIAEGDKKKVVMTKETVQELLGPEKIVQDVMIRSGKPGVATGMAWTPTGGELLFIETNMTPGSGKLNMTGQLGDVMKESATAAMSYLHANQKELKLPKNAFEKHNFHVHVPAGAIPKDGPSAGVAVAAALYSLVRELPFPKDVALTGEISLQGKVLPIGGLKEKVLAAHRADIERVIAPVHNKKGLTEIPEEAREKIRFIWVEELDEALKELFPNKRASATSKKKSAKRTPKKSASKTTGAKKTTKAKKKTGAKKKPAKRRSSS